MIMFLDLILKAGSLIAMAVAVLVAGKGDYAKASCFMGLAVYCLQAAKL